MPSDGLSWVQTEILQSSNTWFGGSIWFTVLHQTMRSIIEFLWSLCMTSVLTISYSNMMFMVEFLHLQRSLESNEGNIFEDA